MKEKNRLSLRVWTFTFRMMSGEGAYGSLGRFRQEEVSSNNFSFCQNVKGLSLKKIP